MGKLIKRWRIIREIKRKKRREVALLKWTPDITGAFFRKEYTKVHAELEKLKDELFETIA